MVLADMVVADIDFPCGRYRLAVADMVVADMVCGRYGRTPLPPPSTALQNYRLQPRAHSQQLLQHTGHLTDSNFITRMLFTDIY